MDNEIIKLRILIGSEEEKERIIKAISTVFNIISCSKMYKLNRDKKHKNSNGYYVYLEVKYNRNIRGAGRKSKFNEQQKNLIYMYSLQGKTTRELAKMFNCSNGTIHNIINK